MSAAAHAAGVPRRPSRSPSRQGVRLRAQVAGVVDPHLDRAGASGRAPPSAPRRRRRRMRGSPGPCRWCVHQVGDGDLGPQAPTASPRDLVAAELLDAVGVLDHLDGGSAGRRSARPATLAATSSGAPSPRPSTVTLAPAVAQRGEARPHRARSCRSASCVQRRRRTAPGCTRLAVAERLHRQVGVRARRRRPRAMPADSALHDHAEVHRGVANRRRRPRRVISGSVRRPPRRGRCATSRRWLASADRRWRSPEVRRRSRRTSADRRRPGAPSDRRRRRLSMASRRPPGRRRIGARRQQGQRRAGAHGRPAGSRGGGQEVRRASARSVCLCPGMPACTVSRHGDALAVAAAGGP